MAGVGFKAVTAEISTGTSKKTLLQVVAAANHAVMLNEISISFKGTVNTNAPILVEIARQTTAGTMSSLTPSKDHDDSDETLQVTAQHTATAEPTEGDVIMRELVHPQTGFIWQAPFGKDIKIGGGDRLGIAVTAANDVNAVARVVGEE